MVMLLGFLSFDSFYLFAEARDKNVHIDFFLYLIQQACFMTNSSKASAHPHFLCIVSGQHGDNG